MSTIVFQNLQSCFEPQPTETTTLRLKLAAAPKCIELETTNTNQNTNNQMTENLDLGGWNFLQTLPNSSQKPLDIEPFYPYVKLSQKSLELCTENLGSETGSDDSIDISILTNRPSALKIAKPSTRIQNEEHISRPKKANHRSFPPPLTTISGSNSVQVRPHREGGRLVIEAVEAPSSRTCFEAERSYGRLQLRFLKNCEFFYDQKVSREDESNGEFETEENDKNINGDVYQNQENGGNIVQDKKGTNENRKEVEVEMGREKFERHKSSSGCKESGHGNNNGLRNWEAFWVAT